MATLLNLLLLGFYFDNVACFKFELAVMLITMTIPFAFKYIAIIWFGISKLLCIVFLMLGGILKKRGKK